MFFLCTVGSSNAYNKEKRILKVWRQNGISLRLQEEICASGIWRKYLRNLDIG